MTTQNTTRRLRPQLISEDVSSWHGLQTINTYETNRADASAAKLQQAYQAMLAQQQAETEKQTLYRAAADAARLAEWEFHNAVLAMKEVVRGQYGLDSDQAQAVGLKKKSEYKRPSRKKSVTS
ncbi:hypothetical protein VF14_04525 [Nostoc linckia z18]|uniref:Uncharacterized protein n=2 Tax=Nostoc linckia TaxID=92942 RepID=A0A9Q5ZA37_NOSLI|nr:hypothetical protein [Nostoc linckia]PHK40428.1 hypothetical protein VF12_10430 [Nostoc linckia z15]PHK47997.1 hypothetical protein VF13_02540 [Nostoc linckia z16]PHJ61087.1 hypothetical protein VF05_29190 [Nostoc linckia z3]PHJ64768.1 hypothetical protein VF02_12175 [Nostoc linckia z1]PHJ70992.1 hypothetical protein VF03_21030 [Nostoc linckia z2]